MTYFGQNVTWITLNRARDTFFKKNLQYCSLRSWWSCNTRPKPQWQDEVDVCSCGRFPNRRLRPAKYWFRKNVVSSLLTITRSTLCQNYMVYFHQKYFHYKWVAFLFFFSVNNILTNIESLHGQAGCWLVIHQLGWERTPSHISLMDMLTTPLMTKEDTLVAVCS